ncbi:uncharacterized protein V1518DRAFT_408255, partial [Limtongia smithiae]|uniref:uncharacterized protein n=1 Tax=Limtongia smithiae TaxID=1125753 RepID=UPI0034CD295F
MPTPVANSRASSATADEASALAVDLEAVTLVDENAIILAEPDNFVMVDEDDDSPASSPNTSAVTKSDCNSDSDVVDDLPPCEHKCPRCCSGAAAAPAPEQPRFFHRGFGGGHHHGRHHRAFATAGFSPYGMPPPHMFGLHHGHPAFGPGTEAIRAAYGPFGGPGFGRHHRGKRYDAAGDSSSSDSEFYPRRRHHGHCRRGDADAESFGRCHKFGGRHHHRGPPPYDAAPPADPPTDAAGASTRGMPLHPEMMFGSRGKHGKRGRHGFHGPHEFSPDMLINDEGILRLEALLAQARAQHAATTAAGNTEAAPASTTTTAEQDTATPAADRGVDPRGYRNGRWHRHHDTMMDDLHPHHHYHHPPPPPPADLPAEMIPSSDDETEAYRQFMMHMEARHNRHRGEFGAFGGGRYHGGSYHGRRGHDSENPAVAAESESSDAQPRHFGHGGRRHGRHAFY